MRTFESQLWKMKLQLCNIKWHLWASRIKSQLPSCFYFFLKNWKAAEQTDFHFIQIFVHSRMRILVTPTNHLQPTNNIWTFLVVEIIKYANIRNWSSIVKVCKHNLLISSEEPLALPDSTWSSLRVTLKTWQPEQHG